MAAPKEMTCASSLPAFNAVMAADPRICYPPSVYTMAAPNEMTYAGALAAFNAVMAADPRIRALEERRWGDVVFDEEEAEKKKRPPPMVCPWAPARLPPPPTGPRCMVSGCSYRGLDTDEHGICRTCHASGVSSFIMRKPSEMTMAELEKAQRNSDTERKEASRNGSFRLLATLNEEAKAIQDAKDILIKNLDFSAV
jgi:hypothetical protein